MKDKIWVGVGSDTNNIYAGKISKEGEWLEGEQDMTLDCLIAVATHVKACGGKLQITDSRTGKTIYKIIVK